MKIAILIARILLGLPFLIFGLNGILGFLKMPPMADDAGAFSTILLVHKYTAFIGILEIVAGVLLLVGRYVPIALVLLGPILVNILLFHILLAGGSGIGLGLIVTVFEVFLIWAYRISFRGLFDAAPEVS